MKNLNCFKYHAKHLIIDFLLTIPLFMLLCTVFVINRQLPDAIVTGKYFWFYGWMGISAITTTLLYIKNRENIHWQFTDLLVLLFGITALISSYITGGGIINTKWILLALCVIAYFYFRIAISANKNCRDLLLFFLILTALVEGIWGLMQLYGFSWSQHHLFQLTGSFFNPGPYAGYMAVITPLAFYYILADYTVYKRKFTIRYGWYYIRWAVSLLTVISTLLVLPAAMSRASWIAALGGCVVTGIIFCFKKYNFQHYLSLHRKKVIIISAILIICVAAGGTGMYLLKKDSADGRALMWKISLRTIPKHPLGVGLNNFSGSYGDEQAAYFASGRGSEQEKQVAGSPEYAFNEYLQICIELGILSFLLFTGIIISAFYSAYKQTLLSVKYKTGTIGAVTALLIFAFLSYPFNLLPFVIIFVFLLAVVVSKVSEAQKCDYIYSYIFLSAACVTIAFCLYNRYPTYNAYKGWFKQKAFYDMKFFSESEEVYAELYPILNDQPDFLFEYGRILRNTGQYKQSNAILTEAAKMSCDPMIHNLTGQNYQDMKEYESAEQLFQKSANLIPSRHYPYYLLAKLYFESGQIEKALKTARYVIDKTPKVPSPAIEEMKKEMRKEIENRININ